MAHENIYHLSGTAAAAYETQKVPSVFAPLANATLDAVALPRRACVLDVACGTGIIGRLLARRLPESSRIVGVDLNPAMVEVAEKSMPPSPHTAEWYVSDVTELPFGDGEFDIAFCQQGLQFFPDRLAALREIGRVLAPDGRLVLTCWRAISPLFQAVSDALRTHVSQKAARQALEPFAFTDGGVIARLLRDTGFHVGTVSGLVVRRSFEHPREAIRAEMLASPYEGELREAGDRVIERVVSDVDQALDGFRQGTILVIPQEVHLFDALKAASDSAVR